MKTPARISIVGVAALLLIAAGAGGEANPSPQEQIEASAQKIKDLRQERIAALKEAADQVTRLFHQGNAPFDEVLEAQLLVLDAELDAAEKNSDRLAVYRSKVETFKQYEQTIDARVQLERAPTATVLRIKARRLAAEIELEQAKLAEAEANK
jgi:outer membrane protein TolC